MSLEHAIKLAMANPIDNRFKFGAVIYRRNRLISVGLNSYKTHPLQKAYGRHCDAIHLHAEIAAIVNAKCDLTGSSLYVARVNFKNEPRLAKPCAGCERALVAFNIKNVEWTV